MDGGIGSDVVVVEFWVYRRKRVFVITRETRPGKSNRASQQIDDSAKQRTEQHPECWAGKRNKHSLVGGHPPVRSAFGNGKSTHPVQNDPRRLSESAECQRMTKFMDKYGEEQNKNDNQQSHSRVQPNLRCVRDRVLSKEDAEDKECWMDTTRKSKKIEFQVVVRMPWFSQNQVWLQFRNRQVSRGNRMAECKRHHSVWHVHRL